MSLSEGGMDEELRSWKRFASALRGEDRDSFERMMASACEALPAMQASASPFPVEALLMGILFSQHRMIEDLRAELARRGPP